MYFENNKAIGPIDNILNNAIYKTIFVKKIFYFNLCYDNNKNKNKYN